MVLVLIWFFSLLSSFFLEKLTKQVIYISLPQRTNIIFSRIGSFWIAQLNYRIKGYHVYGYKYTVKKELTCTIDDVNLSYIIHFKSLFQKLFLFIWKYLPFIVIFTIYFLNEYLWLSLDLISWSVGNQPFNEFILLCHLLFKLNNLLTKFLTNT